MVLTGLKEIAPPAGGQRLQARMNIFRARGPLGRIAGAVVVILGVVTLTFVLTRVFSADPTSLYVPPSATAATRALVRSQLGLDQPLIIQYLKFILGLVQGNLGISYQTGQPVTSDLLSRLPATLELGLYALVGGVIVGTATGVLAAVNRNGIFDRIVRFLTVGAMALPQFWIGLMLLYLFFVVLGIAPGPAGRLPIGIQPPPQITGFYVVDSLLEGNVALASIAAQQLVLPAFTLALGLAAPVCRTARTAMVQALGSDYILAARALGLGRARIWFAYALKNALLPVITILAGVIGWTFSGSVLVEGIFGWPGVGAYALTALQKSDFPAIQGFVLYAAVVYVVIYGLLEFAYSRVDPRIAS